MKIADRKIMLPKFTVTSHKLNYDNLYDHQWTRILLNCHIFHDLLWKRLCILAHDNKDHFVYISAGLCTASTTHLNPRVKDIVLWFDRIHIVAIVKMIDCNHDNWRSIKLFSKIAHLTREHNFGQR